MALLGENIYWASAVLPTWSAQEGWTGAVIQNLLDRISAVAATTGVVSTQEDAVGASHPVAETIPEDAVAAAYREQLPNEEDAAAVAYRNALDEVHCLLHDVQSEDWGDIWQERLRCTPKNIWDEMVRMLELRKLDKEETQQRR